MLRHAVFAEVPHVLFAAHYAGARIFGMGLVFLDGGSQPHTSRGLLFGGLAVYGARGRVPPAARAAELLGVPVVLAHVHYRRPHSHGGGRSSVCVPHRALYCGVRGYHVVQQGALWQPIRFRRELQPHGKRYDEARHGGGPHRSCAVRVFIPNSRDYGRVPLFAGCLVRHHVFGANGKGSHVRRHFRRAPYFVGASVRPSHSANAHQPA